MSTHTLSRARLPGASRQRGVVLLFSLIALGIMLIVAVALVRSFNSSLFTAGSIGFKRDLQNQSERAVEAVLTEFRSGGNLASPGARGSNKPNYNYSATMLPVNAQGIPNALQNNTSFAAVGSTGKDIPVPGMSVTVRYVVDRLCATTGDETALGAGVCRLADNPVPPGDDLFNSKGPERNTGGGSPAGSIGVVYRLSIRVTGPRNTQSFFQSTFTVPS
jgi:type IV pilus assembly protein PilX